MTGNNPGWGGDTLRQLIPVGDLLSGSKVRLTLAAATTGTAPVITAAYAGNRAGSGDAYDFATTPVPITVAGSPTFTIPINTEVVTDEIVLTVGATDLIISAHFSAGDCRQRVPTTGWTTYYKTGADASTVNTSGYSSTPGNVLIRKIEVFLP